MMEKKKVMMIVLYTSRFILARQAIENNKKTYFSIIFTLKSAFFFAIMT